MAALHPTPFAAGMATQLAALRSALAAGIPRLGWKIGLNVPEVQRTLGLAHPGVGWLRGDRRLDDGGRLAPPPGARLHVEAELGIVVAHHVPATASADEARDAIAAVAPALEIVDYVLPAAGLDAIVAHSYFHAATVLGPGQPLARLPALGDDLPALAVGDRHGPPPRSDLVPADPANVVRFVARFLAAFDERLEAGDVVISGAYMARAIPIAPGETADAHFGALGDVRVTVVDA